jgi:nucleoside-diphosphate kinase
MERTLAIFKPDCIKANLEGKVMDKILQAGFAIAGLKMLRMSESVARAFYSVHEGKAFFNELIDFMTEGPCMVAVLEKVNAVEDYRLLMGATNPQKAAVGTIRKEFAENISRNIVHGSDSPENAKREVLFFFSESELIAIRP